MTRYTKQDNVPIVERKSICLPGPGPEIGVAVHCGEDGFVQKLTKHFPTAENNAIEKLCALKAELRVADTETFWKRLMEGLTEICQAQYGFVAKRILVDDHDAPVEMPMVGEAGSCLMGVAFYYNDGQDQKAMHRDYKYMAWGAPCGYMKHDKVFLIPDHMSKFITDNPNALPFTAEGYLGVPLFCGEICFAHFGLMWTQKGLDSINFSWGYMEMVLHAVEDLIVERLTSGQGFSKIPSATNPDDAMKVIPKEAITATQSLKPYAKSLSHELRTPMQGVVGMLDVMHATVQEQLEGLSNSKIRNIFRNLRDNIEVVQDSSKRAVEAADNVVHAYDMNMQIPDTPSNGHESPAISNPSTYFDPKPSRLIEGSSISINPFKRRRDSPPSWHFGNANKVRNILSSPKLDYSPKSGPVNNLLNIQEIPRSTLQSESHTTDANGAMETDHPSLRDSIDAIRGGIDGDSLPTPGIKHSNIRSLIPVMITEALRVGGRPDSAISEPIDNGERIEVRTRSSNGYVTQKMIEWSVEPDIPETLFVDERDLVKLLSAVFLNAVKFTEEGSITVKIRLSKGFRYVLVSMTDTGVGIPEEFRPELFKPFSREDDSMTRTKEGLGLGLLVAKGLARRLGGDINLVRSETQGIHRGSEFEIRIPLDAADSISRTVTPLSRTPEPNRGSIHQTSGSTARNTNSLRHDLRERKASSPLQPLTPTGGTSCSSLASKHTDKNHALKSPSGASEISRSPRHDAFDRRLAAKHPLTFLVAEDNKLNRKLLVSMLGKLGYTDVYEAFDGKEAVRIMHEIYEDGHSNDGRMIPPKKVDVILMDLWMPELDGYQATEQIRAMFSRLSLYDTGNTNTSNSLPTILAVSADVTDEAIHRASQIGMEGFMTKPYKLMDLQRLILEFCVRQRDLSPTSSFDPIATPEPGSRQSVAV